jgi:hypothetical protein
MKSINSFITISALPPLSAGFTEDKISQIGRDFQNQHYTDHMSIYSVINSLYEGLGLKPIQIGLPNLFFSDTPSFNNFLQENRNEHAIFYEASNIIAETLVNQGYGVTPTLINFEENPIMSVNELNFDNLNRFIMQEYNIHRIYMRYLNILLATLNKTNVPSLPEG